MEGEIKALRSVSIITPDVPGLRSFYESVLELSAAGDDKFAYFTAAGAGLSLSSRALLDEMAPGAIAETRAGSCFLEFEVQDVDAEYERLKELNVDVFRLPTTQTWGIRSVWFRDPEGNLVNFFARVA